MIVFLNGRFVPAEQALIPVSDRGFLLGDGLFETVPVHAGRPFCWPQHLARLNAGADLIGIVPPFSTDEMTQHAAELIARNGAPEAILRLTLTRGGGQRGYSPKGSGPPALVMTLEPTPLVELSTMARWNLHIASVRVALGDALAGFKHTSRLAQVLARAQAEASGADEALLLNTAGEIVEATAGNVFWIEGDTVHTPPVCAGALAGITRSLVLGLCARLGIASSVRSFHLKRLPAVEGMFLTLSSRGIVEAVSVDRCSLATSGLTARLHAAWADVVRRFRMGEVDELESLAPYPPPA